MKNLVLMAITMMAFSMPAFAGNHGEGKMDAKMQEEMMKHYFQKMDINGDGKISQAEHANFADRMFIEADKNGNGSMSMDEFKKHKESMHKKKKM